MNCIHTPCILKTNPSPLNTSSKTQVRTRPFQLATIAWGEEGEELYETGIINTGISWWRIYFQDFLKHEGCCHFHWSHLENVSKVSLSFIFYENMLIWSVDIECTQLFMIYKKVISELFSLFTYWKLDRGITLLFCNIWYSTILLFTFHAL